MTRQWFDARASYEGQKKLSTQKMGKTRLTRRDVYLLSLSGLVADDDLGAAFAAHDRAFQVGWPARIGPGSGQ